MQEERNNSTNIECVISTFQKLPIDNAAKVGYALAQGRV